MPLDVQLGDEDLAHILADSAARAVVTTERRVAREALPPGRAFRRFSAVTIYVGNPCSAEELRRAGHGEKAHERIANGLQQRVAELRAEPRMNKI